MLNMFKDDGKLVIQKKTDPNPSLAAARVARDMLGIQNQPFAPSDSWHVGRIDKHVLEMWIKEAGLKWSDREAVKDLIKRKLMSSDNAAFRVKEGSF